MSAPMKCVRCGLSKVIFSLTCRNFVAAASKLTLPSRNSFSPKYASVNGINAQLSAVRFSGSDAGAESSDDEKKVRKKLDLAKPGRKRKPRAKGDDLKSQIMKATEAVSEALGGDKEKTQSELLAALRSHITPENDAQSSNLTSEKAQDALKSLFSGIKVEGEKRDQLQRRPQEARQTRGPRQKPDIELYSGEALGIFKGARQPIECTPNFYDQLEAEEIRKKTKFPVANAFEEMIDWTKEGKLWKYPIDNEQDLDEEALVGFHEHVFLEHLLEEGFPTRGPIRHFMELVIVGLSKNPYLTVQEKHAHVDWFRNYFKDKVEIVESLMAESKAEAAEKGIEG